MNRQKKKQVNAMFERASSRIADVVDEQLQTLWNEGLIVSTQYQTLQIKERLADTDKRLAQTMMIAGDMVLRGALNAARNMNNTLRRSRFKMDKRKARLTDKFLAGLNYLSDEDPEYAEPMPQHLAEIRKAQVAIGWK